MLNRRVLGLIYIFHCKLSPLTSLPLCEFTVVTAVTQLVLAYALVRLQAKAVIIT